MLSNEVLTTIYLSVKIGFIATIVNIPIALFLSYIICRIDFPGKTIVEGFINLPLVLPPVTTGFLLISFFGKRGFLGKYFYLLTGQSIAFTQVAAIIAAMVVSLPLIIRSINISMDMLDRRLEVVGKTMGLNSIKLYFRITLPLIIPGVITGFIMGFARSLGEFGATITFAGNIEGVTRTIPLSVYSLLQIPGREKQATTLVLISIFISFLSIFSSSFFNKKYYKWRGSNAHRV